jgi:enediyne biosynthesis protein E3
LLSRFRRSILGIPLSEITFARRGFHNGDRRARKHLERVGSTFVYGYHAALDSDDAESLAQHINRIDSGLRGFAFEGASMGLTLLDRLTFLKRDRLRNFLNGPASAHPYMVHVGVGWALARVPWLRRRLQIELSHLDPLLRWLVVDGFGFHEGYFQWRRYVADRAVPRNPTDYALRVFDQGLGRSIWFVDGADVRRISSTIAAFPRVRQADLWSGIGLACTYAGGVDRNAIEILHNLAGQNQSQLAQGAAFAAKARQLAGNQAEHTELACRVFCGISADSAAAVTDEALLNLPSEGTEPAYEIWRTRIRKSFC